MAKTKVRLSVKEYDKLIKQYGTLLRKMDRELGGLHVNLDTVQKGDSEGPYWNGAIAKKFYQQAITNLGKDLEAYKAVAKVYKALVEKRKEIKTKKLNS